MMKQDGVLVKLVNLRNEFNSFVCKKFAMNYKYRLPATIDDECRDEIDETSENVIQ